MKPFSEGDFVKEAIIAGMESLLQNYLNRDEIMDMIRKIPLNRMTVSMKAEILSKNSKLN